MWKRCMLAVILAIPAGLLLGFSETEAQKVPAQNVVHARGYKLAPLNVRQGRHDRAAIRNKHWKRALPVVNAPTWDSRTKGWCGPIADQDGCGDCYIFSACEVAEDAQYVVGNVTAGFALSRQWFLDCHPELGGCGGGDEWEVSQIMLNTGCPSTAQYVGLGQNPGNCQDVSKMTMYKISAMGYCTAQIAANGVANTQDIKNSVAAYGSVSVAVAAGSDWDNYSAGQVITSPANPNGINHAVLIIGWKTGASGQTVWLVQNSWGTSYGDNGTLWIQENSDSIGTEAYWTTAISNTPPISKAPYKLFEGTMVAPVQVGTAAGYQDLPSAEADGRTLATKDNMPVMVHDNTNTMVETIQPGTIPPPPPPAPQTITFTFTPSPFSFSTGGVRSRTITVTPPSQTVTATLSSNTARGAFDCTVGNIKADSVVVGSTDIEQTLKAIQSAVTKTK